jgi:hypothetical protein
MRWAGYSVGLLVGTVLGYWLHGFWQGDLTGVGSPPPPEFDLAVPVVVFALATAALAMAGRR